MYEASGEERIDAREIQDDKGNLRHIFVLFNGTRIVVSISNK